MDGAGDAGGLELDDAADGDGLGPDDPRDGDRLGVEPAGLGEWLTRGCVGDGAGDLVRLGAGVGLVAGDTGSAGADTVPTSR